MRQRKHRQVKSDDSGNPSASALRAVQVALDRRDNGGDAPADDDE